MYNLNKAFTFIKNFSEKKEEVSALGTYLVLILIDFEALL